MGFGAATITNHVSQRNFPTYTKLTHGRDHASAGGMYNSIYRYWNTKGFTNYSLKFRERCIVCATNNYHCKKNLYILRLNTGSWIARILP